MNNLHYDFENTGYKIHLPVVPDVNDPLTRKIADYLDNIYGTSESDRFGFKDMGGGRQGCYSKYFKIGNCSDALEDGKGITIYGKQSTATEMEALAKDIEARFGKELANNITTYNITPTNMDRPLTQNITTRFAAWHFGIPNPTDGVQNIFMDYNQAMNPSGALTKKVYKDINGNLREISSFDLLCMSDIDKKFVYGDSTLAMLDNFGELFTGKIQNGKVPKFIMDGLPKEYLQHYNLTEKDIIARINAGTKQLVANMLEDVVINPNSKILQGNPPWLATLDTEVINEAKLLLAKHDPRIVQKLEQLLPQLEKKCPALYVLKNTTPYHSINTTAVSKTSITPVGSKTPINIVNIPIAPTSKTAAVQPVQFLPSKAGWFDGLSAKGKVGAITAGATLTAGVLYVLANQPLQKEAITIPAIEKPEIAKTNVIIQKPVKYCMYCGNPLRNYSSPMKI